MTTSQARVDRPVDSLGIAICTYRRPHLLRALLESIRAQDFDGRRPSIEIAVVDNSRDLEGMAVARELATSFPFTIHIDHEPEPGIAPTRNRTVALLRPCDAIVFVDDDETVSPRWLASLIDAAERYDADVVSGPVIPSFAVAPPAWVIEGGFYERERHATGAITGVTATSNLLVRHEVFESIGQPFFDPALGLMGCDDQHFLERALRNGHVAIWSDEAVVTETFPADRVNTYWLVQRKFRGGNSYAVVQRMLAPGWRTDVRLLAKAVARITGTVLLLPIAVWRAAPRVKALRSLAQGAGQIAAFANVRYEEYRRTSRRHEDAT